MDEDNRTKERSEWRSSKTSRAERLRGPIESSRSKKQLRRVMNAVVNECPVNGEKREKDVTSETTTTSQGRRECSMNLVNPMTCSMRCHRIGLTQTKMGRWGSVNDDGNWTVASKGWR